VLQAQHIADLIQQFAGFFGPGQPPCLDSLNGSVYNDLVGKQLQGASL
jgi:hypothetical protein